MVEQRGVRDDRLHTGQTQRRGGPPHLRHVPQVPFHQPGADVLAARMGGQDAQQVAALTGTETDHPERAGRSGVQGRSDTVLNRAQPPGQR